jgi:hypothetical protein
MEEMSKMAPELMIKTEVGRVKPIFLILRQVCLSPSPLLSFPELTTGSMQQTPKPRGL